MKYLLLGLAVIPLFSSCSMLQPPAKPVPPEICAGHADFTRKVMQ